VVDLLNRTCRSRCRNCRDGRPGDRLSLEWGMFWYAATKCRANTSGAPGVDPSLVRHPGPRLVDRDRYLFIEGSIWNDVISGGANMLRQD